MFKPRYLEGCIRQELEEKMIFLSGPRQVGKTTLAKSFLQEEQDRYFNWDNRKDRREILAARWPAEKAILVFDELHISPAAAITGGLKTLDWKTDPRCQIRD